MQSLEATQTLARLDRAQIESLIYDFWSLRVRDSAAAVKRYMDEDAEYRVCGEPTSFSGPRRFKGTEAIIGAMRAFDTSVEVLSYEVLDLIIDGREAALLWQGRLRNRGAGTEGGLVLLEHFVTQDGRITGRTIFLDTDGLQRLTAGEPQSSAARIANRMTLPPPVREPIHDLIGYEARCERTREFVRSLWRDRLLSGAATVPQYYAPDATLVLISDPAVVPFARRREGHAAIAALRREVDIEFEFVDFEVNKILVDGDRAAAHWHATLRHRGTSALAFVEVLDHMVLRNGLIQHFTQFLDTAAVGRSIAG
jgi:ketosteroid isomerase-like protein